MRWELDASSASNEIYHLFQADKMILTLVIDPFSHTARIEYKTEKRVFHIRKEGFIRNKIVLRNEYGIKIGELGHDSKENFIDVNDERFYYTIGNEPTAELVLYKESKEQPFVTCSLKTREGNAETSFKKDKSRSTNSHPGLLMALCWYMFLPLAKQNEALLVS